jgi:hypothetical protein
LSDVPRICDGSDESAILVLAKHGDADAGTIRVAATTHDALYYLEGFDRRWDFGPMADGPARYAFVAEPHGDDPYFDFGCADAEGRATARQLFACRNN